MNQKTLDILEKHEKFMADKYGDDLLLIGGAGHIIYDEYNLVSRTQ